MANFSVPMGTVFRQAGGVMVTLTAMMDQMKLAVVSYLPTEFTHYIGAIVQTALPQCSHSQKSAVGLLHFFYKSTLFCSHTDSHL